MAIIGDIVVIVLWLIFLSFIVLAFAAAYLLQQVEEHPNIRDFLGQTRIEFNLVLGVVSAGLCMLALIGYATSGTGSPLSDGKLVTTVIIVVLALGGYWFGGRSMAMAFRLLVRAERGEEITPIEGKVRVIPEPSEARSPAER